jgi:exodeoxyribonuclease VII large subunit
MQGSLPSFSPDARIETVSELVRRLRGSLEQGFGDVWVGGEISNFRAAASGHWYFVLKDARSQLAAVMFRSAAQTVPFRPEDGLEIVLRGRVSLYDARGDLQIYAEWMEPRGLGAMRLALEQLRRRLASEGLFAPERKRPLPVCPRGVGVITALKGAAVHDIVSTLRRRWRSVRIVVRPVRVQGRLASADIVAALAEVVSVPEIDVVIVGRGGGSIEDLWAFNEEPVVRAIAACSVAVVSAVGHEIDVTLADLVADQRAATPTAAAALVVPDQMELATRLDRCAAALETGVRVQLRRRLEQLAALATRLRDPRDQLHAQRLRIDELGERARRALESRLRLASGELQRHAERLQALSPLAVLERGYAIARHTPNGEVVRDATEIRAGERLELTFSRGVAEVRVEKARG